MSRFKSSVSRVLNIEGGYSNDPKDSGGETNWGITSRLAREYGFKREMKTMTRDEAIHIYHEAFWKPLHLEEIAALSEEIADEVFDSAVNVWTLTAARWLQFSLNALNEEARRYPDLVVDGHIGNATLSALSAYLKWRKRDGVFVLLAALNTYQGAHYLKLSQDRPKDERFVYGWFLNRVVFNFKR